MLRGETEEVQRRIRAAMIQRDGPVELGAKNFRFFDTICGATQERQDALSELLNEKMDLLLVVGGYNSSNTSHLAEMGEAKIPTYFVRGADKLESAIQITHYNLHRKSRDRNAELAPERADHCRDHGQFLVPNNLIEETIFRVYELRGVPSNEVLAA